MTILIAAALVALFLHRQEIRHRAELLSRTGAILPSPVPFLEALLSLVVGIILTATGARMLWSMIHGQPPVAAIDNVQSVMIFLCTGLIISASGVRALRILHRERKVDRASGRREWNMRP